MADHEQPEREEVDLYDDLGDTKPAHGSTGTATFTSSSAKTKKSTGPKSFVDQVSELEKQVQKLVKENDQLKRNMGTLYRTAKHEIQRKDAEIESLMKDVESLQQQHQ